MYKLIDRSRIFSTIRQQNPQHKDKILFVAISATDKSSENITCEA